MISFVELTNQVHQIKDMILSDLTYVDEQYDDPLVFSKHLYVMRFWFSRISWHNKMKYILVLLEDVKSIFTISLLLKSMWNCRPKDAVMSLSSVKVWSTFDIVPLDHNRTARSIPTLIKVMKIEHKWFLTLNADQQAMVLLELLSVSGAPIMLAVSKRANQIYQTYKQNQIDNIKDNIVENPKGAKGKPPPPPRKTSISSQSEKNSKQSMPNQSRAGKELDVQLAIWNSALKSLRDSTKMEETEITFKDGTQQKIWKVNRPKPEATETVDIIQLLPASIGKLIFSYLPQAQLGDYARVNKYWAYLIDDLRQEIAVRLKIEHELQRLQEIVMQNEIPFNDTLGLPKDKTELADTPQKSLLLSEPTTYSFPYMIGEQKTKPRRTVHWPIKKMKDVTEGLERRGAADENLFKWCAKVLRDSAIPQENNGVLKLDPGHFPCPLMKNIMTVPLKKPLNVDPAVLLRRKRKSKMTNVTSFGVSKTGEELTKRFSVWSTDFSSLYQVCKIPIHESPV